MEILNAIGLPLLMLVKSAIIIFLVVYIIFAVVLVRQVRLMTETLEVGFEKVIASASYVHLLVAILTLVASIVFL